MDKRSKQILQKMNETSKAITNIEDKRFEIKAETVDQMTIQYLPTRDAFVITGKDFDVVRNLQWCKDVIDKFDKVPHNWQAVMNNPDQVFYL